MRTSLLVCLGWCALVAQGFAQAPPPGASVSGGGGGDYKSSTAEGGADRLFDVNSDSVDMENGSMQWKGKTFNLGNSRAMRMRFERYLSAPAAGGDMLKYQDLLRRIERLLAPNSINASNYLANQQEAFNLLFQAAEYEVDGNNCLTIATQVQKVWNMRAEFRQLEVTKNQLEAIRKAQEGVVVNRADKIEGRQ
ncbi:hypothetical protein EMGBD4_03200 [Verrucomicrobiota bacterium]|nr:hypothetical protein EMGBD4_03200 [Verrucomicrobiota bacterium]